MGRAHAVEANAVPAGGGLAPLSPPPPPQPPPRSFARLRGPRLVEVRVLRLADLRDVEALNAEVMRALDRAGPDALVYADHRRASPVSRDVADAWARGIRGANRSLARSAILLDPDNKTYNLQLERIVRCTYNSARCVFFDRADACAWLAAAGRSCDYAVLERLAASGGRLGGDGALDLKSDA